MLGAMRAFCKRNQPVLCSPFVLGGANTPASTAANGGAAERRGPIRPRLYAGCPQGLPGDLWPLPVDCFDEVRRTDGGHA